MAEQRARTATVAIDAGADGKAPRTERGRRTQQAILDAAAQEFGERGFHDASISGITRRAGTALGSFYTAGRYRGRHAGTVGRAGVYSFNGNKIITTGGGGMVVARDPAVLRRVRHLSTQAKADEVCERLASIVRDRRAL